MRLSISFAACLSVLVNASHSLSESVTDELDHLNTTDRYIVTLKPHADLSSHITFVQNFHNAFLLTRRQTPDWEGVTHQYRIESFQAYAAHLPTDVVEQLRVRSDVDHVEEDAIWTTGPVYDSTPALDSDTQAFVPMTKPIVQAKSGYGLGIISHAQISALGYNQYLYDESAGENTYAYVVGTGININHADFQGRATLGFNALVPDSKHFTDEFGHGTIVAGLIGSERFGVAKKSHLIAVKVLNRTRGKLSQILDGYQWAVNDLRKRGRTKNGAINVSIYGAPSKTFNKMLNVASAKGVTTVTCAGDEGKEVAMSPGSADTAITVSATDDYRVKAKWANWGKEHVHLFAPGSRIMSTWIGSDKATAEKSGTSLAAGYVTGIVLYFKGLPGATLDDAFATKKFLLKHALVDEATLPNGKGLFAYNGSGK
ncbi:hypothetical protein ANO11243_090980 [Dothideomycetidae sp. 11243]|nr:hypothetical protein ANO11243_090980 [fungal sp. No.11243]